MSNQEIKFCPYCGMKLLAAANFCAGCGSKQPSLKTPPAQTNSDLKKDSTEAEAPTETIAVSSESNTEVICQENITAKTNTINHDIAYSSPSESSNNEAFPAEQAENETSDDIAKEPDSQESISPEPIPSDSFIINAESNRPNDEALLFTPSDGEEKTTSSAPNLKKSYNLGIIIRNLILMIAASAMLVGFFLPSITVQNENLSNLNFGYAPYEYIPLFIDTLSKPHDDIKDNPLYKKMERVQENIYDYLEDNEIDKDDIKDVSDIPKELVKYATQYGKLTLRLNIRQSETKAYASIITLFASCMIYLGVTIAFLAVSITSFIKSLSGKSSGKWTVTLASFAAPLMLIFYFAQTSALKREFIKISNFSLVLIISVFAVLVISAIIRLIAIREARTEKRTILKAASALLALVCIICLVFPIAQLSVRAVFNNRDNSSTATSDVYAHSFSSFSYSDKEKENFITMTQDKLKEAVNEINGFQTSEEKESISSSHLLNYYQKSDVKEGKLNNTIINVLKNFASVYVTLDDTIYITTPLLILAELIPCIMLVSALFAAFVLSNNLTALCCGSYSKAVAGLGKAFCLTFATSAFILLIGIIYFVIDHNISAVNVEGIKLSISYGAIIMTVVSAVLAFVPTSVKKDTYQPVFNQSSNEDLQNKA